MHRDAVPLVQLRPQQLDAGIGCLHGLGDGAPLAVEAFGVIGDPLLLREQRRLVANAPILNAVARFEVGVANQVGRGLRLAAEQPHTDRGQRAQLLVELDELVELEGLHIHLVGPCPARPAQRGEARVDHVWHHLDGHRVHWPVVGAVEVGTDGTQVP